MAAEFAAAFGELGRLAAEFPAAAEFPSDAGWLCYKRSRQHVFPECIRHLDGRSAGSGRPWPGGTLRSSDTG